MNQQRKNFKPAEPADNATEAKPDEEISVANAASAPPKNLRREEVRAVFAFFDARSGRQINVDDVITEWEKERIDIYAARGLVRRIDIVGPSEYK